MAAAPGSAPREVEVQPVSSGTVRQLEYRDWVESRRAYVEERSGGRLWAATDRGLWVMGTDMSWRQLPSADPPSPGFIGTDFDYIDVLAGDVV